MMWSVLILIALPTGHVTWVRAHVILRGPDELVMC
jgi:hypothetical protein